VQARVAWIADLDESRAAAIRKANRVQYVTIHAEKPSFCRAMS
jgi:hypothetical protein